MATSSPEKLDSERISELRKVVRRTDAGAFLVEPRVIRRVIREIHGFARLSPRIPHSDVCLTTSARVRQLTHPDELGLETFEALADPVLLISLPEEHENLDQSSEDHLILLWRRLFHGAVDRAVQATMAEGQLSRARVQECIDQIGQVEFDEAHSVLAAEQRLIDPESRIEAFTEFVAVFWELLRFAPDQISAWFPSLTNRDPATVIPEVRIDPQLLFITTRLADTPDPDMTPQIIRDEAQLSGVRQDWLTRGSHRPSERRYERQRRRRDRAHERGNAVAAALAALNAAEAATTQDRREFALQVAETDMDQFVGRLQSALLFSDEESERWRESIGELFHNSTHGFWNADKRLLHDLQKVCLDHERVTYKVDLVKWIVSRGKRPLRRPLTNLREVMMANHLASSASRLVYVRLSGVEREQLADLLHHAADLAEHQMRERMRPSLRQTLLEVGLKPDNVPEEVAFDKLIEESLDCIARRGYLTMGYLRDSISRNDLKLADLTDTQELFRGDHLLRTDDKLDIALDGVYRRGEFYLRGLQRVSSLAFGTRPGRFFTQFVAIPFGGALIIVEGVSHLVELLLPGEKPATDAPTVPVEQTTASENKDGSSKAGEEEMLAAAQDAADSIPRDAPDDDAGQLDGDGTEMPPPSEIPVAFAGPEAAKNLREIVQQPVSDVIHREHLLQPSTRYSLIVLIGLLVMALMHHRGFRQGIGTLLNMSWRITQTLMWRLPKRFFQFHFVQWIIRSPVVTVLRRYIVNPGILAFGIGIAIPVLLRPALGTQPLTTTWTVILGLLFSLALNSRLGRDTEELAAEWIGNALHKLRARVVMAAFDWIVDFFKWALSGVERLIYAVDEWLRFHSEESWLTIIVKAVVGVAWSFVVFLIRIYVNLLIEPQVNPIKHFPVVTVAHKIILPLTPLVVRSGRGLLEPFVGQVLADSIVATTWFLFPGVFGFLVWELKENWRLYATNRVSRLQPVVVGGHGESLPRLLRPGFHSGTLPKAFGRLRRLERQSASFRRFSQRRAWQDVLHHAERDLRRFVDRDLIRLLDHCAAWDDHGLQCRDVQVACNSIRIQLQTETDDGPPFELLLQEQSHWIVATVAEPGFLRRINADRLHSLDTALQGFYRKAGVELVEEQIQQNLSGAHPFDVGWEGLTIWPEGQFDREVTVDLLRPHQQLRPLPTPLAMTFGISTASADSVLFSKSETNWNEWVRLWQRGGDQSHATQLPLACVHSAGLSLLPHN